MEIDQLFNEIKNNLKVKQIMTKNILYYENGIEEDIDIYPCKNLRSYYDKKANKIKDITINEIISQDLDLLSLIKKIKEKEFFFVIHENSIIGIVTPADLKKSPIRALFYFLIYDLEITCKNIFYDYSDDKIQSIIKKPIKDKEDNISLIEKLYLYDFLEMLKNEKIITNREYKNMSSLDNFRNWIMHPSKNDPGSKKRITDYLYEKLELINSLKKKLNSYRNNLIS